MHLSPMVCITVQRKDLNANYRGRGRQFSEFIVKREDRKSSRACMASSNFLKQHLLGKSPGRQASKYRYGTGPGNRKQQTEAKKR